MIVLQIQHCHFLGFLENHLHLHSQLFRQILALAELVERQCIWWVGYIGDSAWQAMADIKDVYLDGNIFTTLPLSVQQVTVLSDA